MPEISFVDTTLRDGSQSLWARRMSTSMMLSVIDDLDAAGFESMEFGDGPRVAAVDDLDEDPSAWLRLGPPRAKHTRLRHHGGLFRKLSSRGSGTTPKCVKELEFRRVVAQGVTLTRTTEPWNNMVRFGAMMSELEKFGMQMIVSLVYSISPRHTDEYFVQKASEAAATKPYRICLKDVGGILTPERARVLIPKILAAVDDVEVEFHTHGSSGMAPMTILVAAECGIRSIHTGVPPLADGNAQPSIFAAVQNLRELGFDTAIDLEPLKRVSEKLYAIARREGYAVGAPVQLDYRQFKHQIPGGMISHLAHQLQKIGQLHRLDEVLNETARVREELGYPVMVTPLSQFVGSQAAINVITGKRYESVTDEVIHYAQGYYGEEAIEVMDAELRALILDRQRADELAEQGEGASEESLGEVRARYSDVTDDELIFLMSCGERVLPYMRREKEVTAYRFLTSPEARWLSELPRQQRGDSVVAVQHHDVSMRVGLKGSVLA